MEIKITRISMIKYNSNMFSNKDKIKKFKLTLQQTLHVITDFIIICNYRNIINKGVKILSYRYIQ